MVMRSRATDGRSASKCRGKWPDQLLTHRFGLSTLRKRSAPPACLARTPEKRKNPHWFGGSYGESRLKTVRILIVDDHAVVREGYRALLEKHEGLKVVGEACDAASAYQSYKATRPDVAIMDISMPGRGGIDAIDAILRYLWRTSNLFAANASRYFWTRAVRSIMSSSPKAGSSRWWQFMPMATS